MAINFPNSPANGDTHTAAGTTYVYDATNSVWKRQGSSGGFDPASVSESLIPDANETYDLGSSTNKFRDLYLSGNSITLGTVELSDNGGALEVTPTGGGSAEPFATETYVTTQVNNLVDAAPGTLDTLNELAAALGDDANFSTTVTNSLANKADTSSLATVATSGSYNDLSNTPTIPNPVDISGKQDRIIGPDIDAYGVFDNTTTISLPSSPQPQYYTISEDGKRLWAMGAHTGVANGQLFYQWDLTTAYDVSTNTNPTQVTIPIGTGYGLGWRWNGDGTKVTYISFSNRTFYGFNVTTAYDISTITGGFAGPNISSQDNDPFDFLFDDDGDQLLVLGKSNDRVYRYTLSTPYDVNTLTFQNSYQIGNNVLLNSSSIDIAKDGKTILIGEPAANASNTHRMFEYTLATAWDFDSFPNQSQYTNRSSLISNIGGHSFNFMGVRFSPNGEKLIISGNSNSSHVSEQMPWVYTVGASVETALNTKADTSSLATVATSGSYNDLSNKPSLATVATSGSYNDLSNKPTIPTIDTSVTTVSSPTVNLDLNNSNFKIDLNANSTTVTTSNNPSTGLHEYTFEIKGNASQDTHNIQSNPSNAITNWRTAQQSSITGFTVGVSNYNAFAASPDGQYAVVYQAYSSSNKQLTVFKMSTPGDVTTATSHLVINNISVSAGGRTDHLGMRPSIYFLSDNVTINMFGKTYNAETGSNNNNGAGSHSPFYEYSNKGNWTPDGLHFYAPTGDPNFNKIKRWDATAPFDWSTASLVSTTTMTYQSNSVMAYYGPDKAIHVSGDGTKLIAVGKYISNNHSNYAIDTYSLSTPFDPASATYVGQYTVANGGAIHFGSFTNDGNTYMYSDDDRLKSFTNLATTPVLNTITWPNNFYWEGGSAPTATPNDETDIVRFATTDSGSTFNAWVEKDSDKSAGFDGQYSSLTGAPTLATVATSGSYNDLSNQPTIPSISGLATETYVNTQVSNLVDSAPATLDTLNELAAALGDDANFSTTITNQIAAKADAYSIATVTASGGNFYIDGVQQVTLSFEPGRTYRFDQADSSNGSHPLRFSTNSDGTHGGGSEYTTGVTTNGTAGSAGAYVQIAITNATPTLYYYCVNHSGMGAGSVVGNFSGNYNDLTNLPTLFDGQFSSLTGTPSLYTDSAVDTHLNISGATTGQILSWNGTDYAWIDAAAGGGSSVSVSATAPSSPSEGDLWFDEDDLVMYVWYTDGDSSQWIEANSVTAAAATIHASDTAPSGPSSGDLWFNTTLLDLYVYYADGDSNQWVQVGGAANSQTSGSGGGSSVQSLIETLNTSVTTTDTGTDGHIDFTTNGTARWEITSNGHILPHTNASFDIGSAEKKVRYLFLDSNTMFVGDTSFSEDNIDRSMEVYTDQSAPSSSTDEGKKGDVRIVGNYMYVCINTNEWIRTQIEKDW